MYYAGSAVLVGYLQCCAMFLIVSLPSPIDRIRPISCFSLRPHKGTLENPSPMSPPSFSSPTSSPSSHPYKPSSRTIPPTKYFHTLLTQPRSQPRSQLPLTSLLQTSISLRPHPHAHLKSYPPSPPPPHIPQCPPSPFPPNVSVPQLAGRSSLLSASSFASRLALLCNSYITGMARVRAILKKGFEMSDGRWDACGEIPLGFWGFGD